MHSSTLIFRSLAIVIFIAGGAHLLAYISEETDSTMENNPNLLEPENSNYTSLDQSIDLKEAPETNTSESKNISTLDLIGKWKVSYNSKEFNGSVVYDFKQEGKVINAYTLEYQDEKGYSQKAEYIKNLVIQKFDGSKGKGLYQISYEGENYEVECEIKIIEKINFN